MSHAPLVRSALARVCPTTRAIQRFPKHGHPEDNAKASAAGHAGNNLKCPSSGVLSATSREGDH
eukprot:9741430-Alexandrium_andersonii.AAC.1